MHANRVCGLHRADAGHPRRSRAAFDILGDDDKRAVFLRTGHKGLEAGLSAEDVDPDARRRAAAKPQDLRVRLRCNLKDLLNPLSKEVELERAVVENGRQRSEVSSFHVNIPASAPDGLPVRIMESGHVVDGVAGDVVVRISVGDHPLYERKGPDLVLQKRVSLRQALCGFICKVPLLEGGELAVGVPPGRAIGDPVVVRGYGMPLGKGGVQGGRGAILLAFQVAMPSNTAGVRISPELAAMAWEELEPLSRLEDSDDEEDEDSDDDMMAARRRAMRRMMGGGGRSIEEPMERYTESAMDRERRRVEVAERVAAAKDEAAGEHHATHASPAHLYAHGAAVEAGFERLQRSEMESRMQSWARSCGADRMEEEAPAGGQPVQCAQQ